MMIKDKIFADIGALPAPFDRHPSTGSGSGIRWPSLTKPGGRYVFAREGAFPDRGNLLPPSNSPFSGGS